MSYLTRPMAVQAIKDMSAFHKDVRDLYKNYDMDLLSNLGRRNIIMSQTQEKFFASALQISWPRACVDGRTGQPDITIPELNTELECKLTSRNKSGAISFHTDFETLNQKKELDYLYVIADEDFKSFCALHFLNLTTADFNKVSNGSRGKVAMKKHQGMKKCNVLVGNAICLNDGHISRLTDRLRLANSPSSTQQLQKKISYWKNTPARYSFELEKIFKTT